MEGNKFNSTHKILIIDDSKTFVNHIKREILILGYDVLIAWNGEEGLRLAEEFKPEAIFVDYNMPGLNGVEVIRKLKNFKGTRNSAVVLFTEERKKEVFEKVIDAGADGYMSKKEDLEFLGLHIKVIFRKHNLLEELMLAKNKSEANYEEAKSKENEIKAFSNIVAHDLKNPLSVISTMCSVMKNEVLSDDALEIIKVISRSTERSLDIINGMYSLSGLTNNLRPLQLESITEMGLKAEETLRDKISDSKTIFEINTSGSILCDSSLIIQLFENLLSNSIKFCDKENPRISISSEEGIFYTYISIEDNGPGIDEKDRSSVFETFSRCHNQDYEGLGLGLATIKKIIDYHRGSIEISESESLGGALFKISLFTNPQTIGGFNILNIRKDFLSLSLEECGHRVIFYDEINLDKFRNDHLDIFVYDIRENTEENLIELAKLIKLMPEVKFLAIGVAKVELMNEIMEIGCDEFLMIPYSKDTIQDRIEIITCDLF